MHHNQYHIARTITLRFQTHVPASMPEMPLLGNPPARFPNECRLRTVIATTKLPTSTARVLDRVRPSSSCCCWPCAMRCHPRMRCQAPKVPPSRSVCVLHLEAQPGNQVSSSLLPSLSFSPLSSPSYTPNPLSPIHPKTPHTYHNVYPQHTQEKERGGGARRASRGQRRRERGGVSHALFLTI